MNQLQALTLLRDAVSLTKGVTNSLWYGGPNRHCTIGCLTQVAIDVGFPQDTAHYMMDKFRQEAGETIVNRIVTLTDSDTAGQNPVQRKHSVLAYLNNEIAKLEEQTTPVPTPKDIISTDAPQPVVADGLLVV